MKPKYLLLLFIGCLAIALGGFLGVKMTRESPLLESYGNNGYVKSFIIQDSCNEAEFTTISCQND